jgi:hypothetical protein
MNKLILIVSILLLAGCSQRVMDFTVISSKNIDLSHGANFKRSPTRVKGEDMKHIFLILPAGMPSTKQAMDNAIERVPGTVALLDGVVNKHFWWIPGIYGQSWVEIEGTPLIDPLLLKSYRQ